MKYLNRINSNKCAALFSVFVLLFLLSIRTARYDQIDYGIYLEFANSIIEDQDLNVSNQLQEIRQIRGEPVILTPTNYDPSYHPYLGSLILVPPLLFSKTFSSFFGKYVPRKEMDLPGGIKKNGKQIAEESVLGLLNIVLVYVSFCLIFMSMKGVIPFPKFVFYSHLLFFSTPLFNYTILQPGNMNIVSFFFGAVFFKIIALRKEERINTIVLGGLFSIGFFIRYELALYILLLLYVTYADNKSSLKTVFFEYAKLLAGALPVITFFLLNNYRQFGELFFKYGSMRTDSLLLVEMLFSPLHGYFFVSPICLFLLISFIIFRKLLTHEVKVFFVFVIFKMFLDSFTLSSGINFGARNFLSDFSVIIVGFFLIKARLSSKVYKSSFFLFFLWSVMWNALYYVYLPGSTLRNYIGSFLGAVSITLNRILAFEFSFIFVLMSFILVLFFLFLSSIAYKSKKSRLLFLSFVYSSLFVITIFNFRSNKQIQVQKYSKGRGSELWLYIENIGSYEEREHKLRQSVKFEKALDVKRKGLIFKRKAEQQITEGERTL